MPNRPLVSGDLQPEEAQYEAGLRPRRLAEFTGQNKLKENLSIAIEAAKLRGEAMDHVLLYGPPGLGKTTLAAIIAEELQVEFTTTSGPVLQKKLDLTGILSNIRLHQVFFIDEIHRLLPDVEEMLYSALEDFRVDILVGVGPGARTHSLPMPKFTAIGATTRQGLVSVPLRGRFGLVLRLDPYNVEELQAIVKRSARLLGVATEDGAAEEIARRCRGTPRIANRLLRRVRDYAQVRADGSITLPVAQHALNLLDVDRFGLDEIDQKIMMTILEKYRGGPVGVNTIAASISEEAETIEEVYEPYLIQLGFLNRTPRGRVATELASGRRAATMAEKCLGPGVDRPAAGAVFGDQDGSPHGDRGGRGKPDGSARCLPARGATEHGAPVLSVTRRPMGAAGGNGPGPPLVALPRGSHGRQLGGPPGGAPWRRLYGWRMVARWQMDVSHFQRRGSQPHLAAAFSRRPAGADHIRADGGGRHCHGAGRPLVHHCRGLAKHIALGSRCQRRAGDFAGEIGRASCRER